MRCRDCARYDLENRRCKDAKVNPPTWEDVIEVSNVIGIRSICSFNDYRERLINARGNPIERKPRS